MSARDRDSDDARRALPAEDELEQELEALAADLDAHNESEALAFTDGAVAAPRSARSGLRGEGSARDAVGIVSREEALAAVMARRQPITRGGGGRLHDGLRGHARALARANANATASGGTSMDHAGMATDEGGGEQQGTRLLEALEALSSEAGASMPPSLRGLLEQLQGNEQAMSGLFPFMQMLGSAGHPRFDGMLESLDVSSPPHTQLSALSDLCESLSMSSEDSLVMSGFHVDAFIPAVLAIVRAPANMEVLLLAVRAVSAMLELFPGVAVQIAMTPEHALVPSLCAKLLEIEYMDVAELAFQILEKIVCTTSTDTGVIVSPSSVSETRGTAYRRTVIAANGFVALLQFVDFFPLENQRTAAHVVAALCAAINTDSRCVLEPAFPLIAALLRSTDSVIVQYGCECFQRMIESPSFETDAALAELVAQDDACNALMQILEDFSSQQTDHTSHITTIAVAHVARFLSALLSSRYAHGNDANMNDSGALSVRIRALAFTRLPQIVTKLLEMPEVVGDVSLLREVLKLVMVQLPEASSTLKTGDVEGEGFSLASTRAFAHRMLSSVISIFETMHRKDLRADCLGVIYRASVIAGMTDGDGHEWSADERKEMCRLSAFLSRILRPVGTVPESVDEGVDTKQVVRIEDEQTLVVALQIAEAGLKHGTDGDDSLAYLFERYGVATAIRFYAEEYKRLGAADSNSVGTLSGRLVDEYFSDVRIAEEMPVHKLKSIVTELDSVIALDKSDAATTSIRLALQKLRELSDECEHSKRGAWLTSHEIASSGLSKTLIRLFGDRDLTRLFAHIFLTDVSHHTFVIRLITCIEEAISAEKDAFHVDQPDQSESIGLSTQYFSTGAIASDLDYLTQHIKVKVKIEDYKCIAAGDEVDEQRDDQAEPPSIEHKGLGNYNRNKSIVHDTVVLVEPLARIGTIEEFISEQLFSNSRLPFASLDLPHAGRLSREDDAEEKSGDTEEDDLRNDTPRKETRLNVWYNGLQLSGDVSILEAILKHGPRDGSSEKRPGIVCDVGSIWGSAAPHEFIFRVVGDDEDIIGSPTQDVKEVKEEVAEKPRPRNWWDDVWDLLTVLKHLYELTRKIDSPTFADSTFVNQLICIQVNRAITLPIRVVAHSLPSWCFQVVHKFAFVLDYETRYHFMYATTCGSSRAIQYLCRSLWKKAIADEPPRPASRSGTTSTTASSNRRRTRERGASSRTNSLVNLSRMVKLPRLKVRVARARLLQSAMKLFTIYGGKKAMIEIEFLGEVGTGLGPTTEFYTLVCQELQSVRLQLWRNEKMEIDPAVDEAAKTGTSTGSSTEEGTQREKHDMKRFDALPVRGYHRVAVYRCGDCKLVRFPTCDIHNQLLTREKKSDHPDEDGHQSSDTDSDVDQSSESKSIPQCSICLDTRDWYTKAAVCSSCCESVQCDKNGEASSSETSRALLPAAAASTDDDVEHRELGRNCSLSWWILSDDEVQYLRKVFPVASDTIKHPVLQCAHCDTVNFPGTDAGIVTLDGDRMVARTGRRMFERDYRAVTKHVSPLCEGTPLTQINALLTREEVETLVDYLPKSPEVLESEIESLSYLSETSVQDTMDAVDAPFGLFPKPYTVAQLEKHSKSTKKTRRKSRAGSSAEESLPELIAVGSVVPDVLTWFNFVGRFFAQAILDERLLNLPLARPFLRALRGEVLVGPDVDLSTSIEFVHEFDPAIATSLAYLYQLAQRADASDDAEAVTEVEAMCLSFTMVGDASIELCPGGADKDVTLANLREYVAGNVQYFLHETIDRQVEAFHDGFAAITGCHGRELLQSFTVAELEAMVTDQSTESMWDREGVQLREHMICDHGYTATSRAIADLIAILTELSLEEQRLFVRFVTGANRLPLGGLSKLEPKLTVVRKLASDGSDNDAVLPSASTCTNYLKLPEYSTRETMKTRLLYCIHEGQGSFHLS